MNKKQWQAELADKAIVAFDESGKRVETSWGEFWRYWHLLRLEQALEAHFGTVPDWISPDSFEYEVWQDGNSGDVWVTYFFGGMNVEVRCPGHVGTAAAFSSVHKGQ